MIKLQNVKRASWIKFSIAALLFVLWVIWLENFWFLLGLPVIFDLYITKFIPWDAWKKTKDGSKPPAWKEWLDALVFALVAVYLINIFFFQNYKIPTSSLEKTLLVGDHLFVSKMSYGPRIPQTPLSFPLVQNTFPIINTKSYSEKPQWDYRRLAGFGEVERGDIVVFNFPAGDTVAFLQPNPSYFNIIRQYGQSRLRGSENGDYQNLPEYQQRLMERKLGADFVKNNPNDFGEVIGRPVDRRDNYVKRCVALPGDTFKIRNNQIFINGALFEEPEGVQHNYHIITDGTTLNKKFYERLDISDPERYAGRQGPYYSLPLTQSMVDEIKKMPFIEQIAIAESEPDSSGMQVFPYSKNFPWSRDNYGPVVMPQKGTTVSISMENILLYERVIRNYEGNSLEVKNQQIYINGEPTEEYTFQMDYYFMLGDNRHNSADSRYWGFVPEDHIIGKPLLVWLSLDKNKSFPMNIRWNRFFKYAGE
ncbi:signal peptidase I [Marinilabilia salmonicolor]|jgi:signal peptidase I|uniref:Signal peptidase I n=1 Tax=Marinilabilia salmonicolor TaxID=989 RepID=A0A368V485_9BACT|nr:signal peptidase I [Marinilabilia salmonicolor]RCW34504.1 signal peptidase I [Marinilabilia salmonicolor]